MSGHDNTHRHMAFPPCNVYVAPQPMPVVVPPRRSVRPAEMPAGCGQLAADPPSAFVHQAEAQQAALDPQSAFVQQAEDQQAAFDPQSAFVQQAAAHHVPKRVPPPRMQRPPLPHAVVQQAADQHACDQQAAQEATAVAATARATAAPTPKPPRIRPPPPKGQTEFDMLPTPTPKEVWEKSVRQRLESEKKSLFCEVSSLSAQVREAEAKVVETRNEVAETKILELNEVTKVRSEAVREIDEARYIAQRWHEYGEAESESFKSWVERYNEEMSEVKSAHEKEMHTLFLEVHREYEGDTDYLRGQLASALASQYLALDELSAEKAKSEAQAADQTEKRAAAVAEAQARLKALTFEDAQKRQDQQNTIRTSLQNAEEAAAREKAQRDVQRLHCSEKRDCEAAMLAVKSGTERFQKFEEMIKRQRQSSMGLRASLPGTTRPSTAASSAPSTAASSASRGVPTRLVERLESDDTS